MAFEIVLPRLGWNMETGSLGEWLVKDGEYVEAGQLLFTVEGDKATQEVEALDSGILRISPDAPQPGQEVPVGTLLGYLLAEGEDMPAAISDAQVEAPPPVATDTSPQPDAGLAATSAADGRSGRLPAISPPRAPHRT